MNKTGFRAIAAGVRVGLQSTCRARRKNFRPARPPRVTRLSGTLFFSALPATIPAIASAAGGGDFWNLDWEAMVKDKFYIRAGATHLDIRTESSEVSLLGLNDVAQLALEEGAVAGSGIELEGSTRPSLTAGYLLPWGDGDSWSIETVLAPSFTIDLNFTGTIRDESLAPLALGVIPTGVPALGEKMGSLETLPATFSLLYSFNDGGRSLVPYIGAGLTYVYNFDNKVTNPILTELGEPELSTSNDWGWVLQAGLSTRVGQDWWLNADLKYASGITIDGRLSDISVNAPNLSAVFGPAHFERSEVSVDLDIFALSVNAEWRF